MIHLEDLPYVEIFRSFTGKAALFSIGTRQQTAACATTQTQHEEA
jgi:hypothetical protein